ncbi:type IV pilus assembly protein PilM [Cryobacterium melibiosiphilum]|uniref:Type IV pilus assembly protein PilM n=1 Tax=Cryobacterium melibiosiphilum TaxID=995039 RepID=A0A3A5MEG4_9MICO|nr:type IV pilus assembly protein PilM [Cryobacterium melibiosiphilum]RJT88530.1 type IV pilus assembly protein PilM [Cryobacterium melibiosiphilum]
MTHTTVGIDVGSGALRAVEVAHSGSSRSGGTRPTLLRYHELALPAGAVSSGEVIEPNTVAAALKQLWAEAGFSTRSVVLGMGNQRVLARDLSVPKMSLKRIRSALPLQVQDMLPVPVNEALLDFYPISETTTENGPMVNGLLIAAVKVAVLGNVRAAELAGLTTREVDLIPFALSRSLVSRPGLTGTVCAIDIGAKTTTVVIAVHGVPHFVRIIPTGGDDLTQALRSGLEMDAGTAENLKRQVGLATVNALAGPGSWSAAPAGTDAAGIIADVIGEQLVSLRNTINYFANTRPKDPVRQIILTGGASQLPGLSAALADMTGIAVGAGDPFASVIMPSGSEAVLGDGSSRFAVALGLALGSAA